MSMTEHAAPGECSRQNAASEQRCATHAVASTRPSYLVLIVTGDIVAANILEHVLSRSKNEAFCVERMSRLSDSVARLKSGDVSLVLVDLCLPDSDGIATFDRIFLAASGVPIMTLCPSGQEDVVTESVRRGAQGYLSRTHYGSGMLPHVLWNVILRKSFDASLPAAKPRAESMLESIGDGVISTDTAGRVNYLNSTAERITGWSREEACGRPIAEVFPVIDGVTREACAGLIASALQKDAPATLCGNAILVQRNGGETPIAESVAPIHNRSGEVDGAVLVFHDASAEREMIKKFSRQAHHDSLTDLPNRLLLEDRISQAIGVAKRRGTRLALLFLDLDGFKRINDTCGHAYGDRLLQAVAKRLCGCVRHSDTVSRQGGDEFVILLAEDKNAEDAAITAGKIIKTLAAPYLIEDHEICISASIGISVYPADGADAETLVRNADMAMYLAKQSGRNNFQFFESEMNTRAVEKKFIEENLRNALQHDEFFLHYQPKINLVSGAITGVEALLRWAHPERGVLRAAQFVVTAEECGMIVPIGRWVLREACRQAKNWSDSGWDPILMSVNISVTELRSIGFCDGVAAALSETGLDPRYLELEFTETALLRDAGYSALLLNELKEIGVSLAVAGFGTDYASLRYLSQFPIDSLKLDKSIVHDIALNADGALIVNAAIGLGANLRQRVIAEGVERLDQVAFLRQHHCTEGQGFYFSQPMLSDKLEQLFEAGIFGARAG